MKKKFSIIDLETTGHNRDGQKIIEIAIINFDGDVIEEIFTTLIYPEKFISHQITLITGITNEMLVGKPKFYEVAKRIVEMTEGRTIVAHNVFFDYRFLQREFRELGFMFHRQVFCTCSSFRRKFPEHHSYSLKGLCADLGIEQNNPHRALSDAQNCLKLLKIIENGNVLKTEEKVDHLIPAQLSNFSYDDFPETPGLYFMYDKDNVLLYVGKSINIRGRLKQHFKQFSGMAREHEMKSRVIKVDYLECFDDLPTSLLELHYIKTMKPHYNISGRRKHFKYGLKLCLNSDQLIAGEEIKITTSVETLPLIFCYGSKRSATVAKERIYQRLFGVSLEDMNFPDGIYALKRQMGADVFYERLKTFYYDRLKPLTFPRGEKWSLKVDNDSLKSIWIEGRGEIFIEETPDMRWIMINQVKKKLIA